LLKPEFSETKFPSVKEWGGVHFCFQLKDEFEKYTCLREYKTYTRTDIFKISNL
jgi:hypothetical protein